MTSDDTQSAQTASPTNPARLKWQVRDKLDQINITERVMFPGLDGLSRTLRRYDSPRTR
jgi:hypothetical protein